jgi:hypothetical protein
LIAPYGSFNPRLREGGDVPIMAFVQPDIVSIHASAKEATLTTACQTSHRTFQSTPPRRRRPGALFDLGVRFTVSIHASAKEATPRTAPARSAMACFNPRLREGGDSGRCSALFARAKGGLGCDRAGGRAPLGRAWMSWLGKLNDFKLMRGVRTGRGFWARFGFAPVCAIGGRGWGGIISPRSFRLPGRAGGGRRRWRRRFSPW